MCVIKNKVNVTLCAGFDPKLVPVGKKRDRNQSYVKCLL